MNPTPSSLHSAFVDARPLQLIAQVSASPDTGAAPSQGGGANQQPGGAAGLGGMLMPLVFAVVFYFLFFRPMNKQKKEQEEMNKALRTGDMVVTRGGVIGKITGITDQEVTLEISEKVRVKFTRSAIESKYPPPAEASASTQTATAEKKS